MGGRVGSDRLSNLKWEMLVSQALWLNAVQLKVLQDLEGELLFLLDIILTIPENLADSLLILPSFFGTNS